MLSLRTLRKSSLVVAFSLMLLLVCVGYSQTTHTEMSKKYVLCGQTEADTINYRIHINKSGSEHTHKWKYSPLIKHKFSTQAITEEIESFHKFYAEMGATYPNVTLKPFYEIMEIFEAQLEKARKNTRHAYQIRNCTCGAINEVWLSYYRHRQ